MNTSCVFGVVWLSVFGSVTIINFALCARCDKPDNETYLLDPRSYKGYTAKSYCKVASTKRKYSMNKKVLNK